MSRIAPIPTTRVGDFFIRQRLAEQVQADQVALYQLQNQVSTGRRLQLLSDDAPAALRVINLQRLIGRKGQIQTNIQASNFYLGAAENNLSQVSQELSNLRGEVIGVTSTLSTDSQRQAVIQKLDSTLQFLVGTANSKALGRYLFAGSRSGTQPYDYNGEFVEYFGNERNLRSYVDLELLFETNLPGTEVFGGISTPIRGTADLNPHLTSDTLLSTINGGEGISKNAAVTITVNSGGVPAPTSIVDLSSAVTVGEVARLIEAGAPAGTTVTVDVTGDGLVVRTATGMIAITEVAQGNTAHELGIFTDPTAPLSDTVVGSDLNPAVLKTTPLANLLGTKAQVRIVSTDTNNDIVLTAAQNGDAFNGVTVDFVAGGVAGSEAVSYDAFSKTLTVQVASGVSTAAQVAAAITAEGTFTATVDYRDATTTTQAGSKPVDVPLSGATPITSGGSGEVLDTTSGLVLSNGVGSVALDISQAETVEDLLNLIKGAGLGLSAEINADGTGIDVRSRLSGADLTIGENGGTTATQLGIRSYNGTTPLANFNRGVGVPTANDPADDDLTITARDGTTTFAVNLAGVSTVQDVIDRINTAAGAAGASITARLAVTGNGIEIVDATVGPGTLAVDAVEGSQAAEYLGFIPNGATTIDGSGNEVLTSADRHTLETDSVFNTLLRLRTALEAGDVAEIGRAIDRLDQDISRANFARAEIGARMQNLEVFDIRLQDENVQLQTALSNDLDVDLVEAISNLTARQYAFEASLRTTANLLNVSLLDYI